MKFEQRFTDTITCNLAAGFPHCGAASGNASFPVTLTIRYSQRTLLDRNGFLLDNTWFRQYCESFRHVSLRISCELLMQTILRDTLEEIKLHPGLEVASVEISLNGIPPVSVVLHWDSRESVPPSVGNADNWYSPRESRYAEQVAEFRKLKPSPDSGYRDCDAPGCF